MVPVSVIVTVTVMVTVLVTMTVMVTVMVHIDCDGNAKLCQTCVCKPKRPLTWFDSKRSLVPRCHVRCLPDLSISSSWLCT